MWGSRQRKILVREDAEGVSQENRFMERVPRSSNTLFQLISKTLLDLVVTCIHVVLLNEQEIRVGDADLIRALFERAISLSLPPKKMKVD